MDNASSYYIYLDTFLEMLSVERVRDFLPEMHLFLSDIDYAQVLKVSRSVWELRAFRASLDESRKGSNFIRYWTKYLERCAILPKVNLERLNQRYGHLNFFDRTYAPYIELSNQCESFPHQTLENWHAKVFLPSRSLYRKWIYALLNLANDVESQQISNCEREVIQTICTACRIYSSQLRERFRELEERIESPSAWEAVLQTFPADSDGCFGSHCSWLTYSVKECINWIMFKAKWDDLRGRITPDRFEQIQKFVKEREPRRNFPVIPC